MTHNYPKQAVKDVLAILDDCGATITTLRAEWASDRDPSVWMCFESAEDLDSFAERDGAKVTETERVSPGWHIVERSAMYERPGRRMLIQHVTSGGRS